MNANAKCQVSPASSLSLELTDLLLRDMFLWSRHLKEPTWVVGEHKQLCFTPGPLATVIGDEGCELVNPLLFFGTSRCCNTNFGLGTSGTCPSPTLDCSVIFVYTPSHKLHQPNTNLIQVTSKATFSVNMYLKLCKHEIEFYFIFFFWILYLEWLIN